MSINLLRWLLILQFLFHFIHFLINFGFHFIHFTHCVGVMFVCLLTLLDFIVLDVLLVLPLLLGGLVFGTLQFRNCFLHLLFFTTKFFQDIHVLRKTLGFLYLLHGISITWTWMQNLLASFYIWRVIMLWNRLCWIWFFKNFFFTNFSIFLLFTLYSGSFVFLQFIMMFLLFLFLLSLLNLLFLFLLLHIFLIFFLSFLNFRF